MENNLTLRIKHENNEIEVSIPLNPRTHIGMDKDGTGTAVITLVEELITKIKTL